MEND
jgi:OPA family glycerol-3-phosphate transporter-like MFS transporter 3